MATEPDPTLHERARAWLQHDPDPETCAELEALLRAGDDGVLAERFVSRLRFGTSGIRGPQGAGPNRMNRVTMRWLADGVARHLGPGRCVVVGFDARHNSATFARDAATVLSSHGIRVALMPTPTPTPVLAFAVRATAADMGLMVTASHNPRGDNGCKVFLGDGAQLRAPVDAAIDALIDAGTPPPRTLEADDTLITTIDDTLIERYCVCVASAVRPVHAAPRTAYTALHGVGWATLRRVFERAGLPVPVPVSSQIEPDPDFSTVAFPNPEEPGAMDALYETATECGAALALATDPDGDRLGVAVPVSGGWRPLTGDEIGALLCDHVLGLGEGPDRKVVSAVVCSTLVAKLAAASGVTHVSTLPGFKWIMAEALADPALRPVFAYEESHGYAVDFQVRDKDGISAALRMVELAAQLAERGATLADRLAELAVRHGLHATRTLGLRFDGPPSVGRAGSTVERLRADPPRTIDGRGVLAVRDYASAGAGPFPPANLLGLDLEGSVRVMLRPSGTEPKAKVYLEHVVDVGSVGEVEAVRRAAVDELGRVGEQIARMLSA